MSASVKLAKDLKTTLQNADTTPPYALITAVGRFADSVLPEFDKTPISIEKLVDEGWTPLDSGYLYTTLRKGDMTIQVFLNEIITGKITHSPYIWPVSTMGQVRTIERLTYEQ